MLADNMDRWADPVEEILLHSLKGESKFEIRTVSVQWTQRVGPPTTKAKLGECQPLLAYARKVGIRPNLPKGLIAVLTDRQIYTRYPGRVWGILPHVKKTIIPTFFLEKKSSPPFFR